MKKLTNKKGFTLIEMLVVIAIIAILVAIIIPTVTTATAKANAATDAANLRSAKAAITIKVLDGTYTQTSDITDAVKKSLGIPLTSKTDSGAFTVVITPNGGASGATASTGGDVKVYYGNHAIKYYASLAEGAETADTSNDKTT